MATAPKRSSKAASTVIVRDNRGRVVLTAKRNPAPRPVDESEPSPKLLRAIRSMQAGNYITYESVDHFWADVQRLAKTPRK